MWKDILLGKGEKKKVEEEKGVKESGWSRREKYKGQGKDVFSNLLLRQNRNKYFRAKLAVPRCPLDAPYVALRLPGIHDFGVPISLPTQNLGAASPCSNWQGQGLSPLLESWNITCLLRV